MTQTPFISDELLSRGNVRYDQVLECFAAQAVARGYQTCDLNQVRLIRNPEFDGIPRLQPQFLSGLDRYKCAVGYDEQGCDVLHRCIRSANLRAAASVWTELSVSKRVNSKYAKRSAVVRPFGQVGVALHDRRGRPDTQLYTQLPIDILGQTSGSADNPMGSLAGNGVAGQAERMLGALIA